ncbi:MAG: hypothetical protein J7518_12035 [Nocardioidaceae bacterium]|nr:hypothetical protein [Nocardioidaceae bacterium]
MSDDTPPPPPPEPGAPPPPPPAYGTPPPPPPYGATPPAAGGAYNAVDAIKYGWAKFAKSPATLLVPGLIYLLAVIIVEVVLQFFLQATLLDSHSCTKTVFGTEVTAQCGPGFFMNVFANAIGSFVASLIIAALGAGVIRCALNYVDGKEVNVGDVFGYVTKPNVLAAAALVAVLTFIGTLLCVLPGVIVSYLTAFTMFFVVDKDQSPTEAIRSSITFMTSRFSDTLLFVVLAFVCLVVGAILCGIGLFVAAPVVLIAAAYTFRVLHNEPVAPVEA